MSKEYLKFLEEKKSKFISSGFDIGESKLNKNLFDFQKYIEKAIKIRDRRKSKE